MTFKLNLSEAILKIVVELINKIGSGGPLQTVPESTKRNCLLKQEGLHVIFVDFFQYKARLSEKRKQG